jgi:hypothetical protein
MVTVNRSAIVVKPKQPFLDWLHATDPTSLELTSLNLIREPTIYLIPECDTDEDVAEVLRELWRSSSSNWRVGTQTPQPGRATGVLVSSTAGSIISTIPCWLIFAMNR